ncbi:MAG: amidohydrolase family protein, partial [Planctomycetes bacterium]|nr:amidohydrolase family protein [Planctomycetota bacterium]
GLDERRALAMLTISPAELLGVGDLMGTIQAGKVANLIVADGPIFEKKTKIRDVWIDGRRHEISPPPPIDIVGEWKFDFDTPGHGGTLIIKKKGDSYTVSGIGDDEDAEELVARNVKLVGNRLSYLVDMPEENTTVIATIVFEGDTLTGVLRLPDGQRMPWVGERAAIKDPYGSWNAVELGDTPVEPGDTDAPVFVVARSGVTVRAAGAETEATDVSVRRGEVSFTFDGSEMRMGGEVSVAATIEGDTLTATLTPHEGRSSVAKFRRAQPDDAQDKADADKYADIPENLGYPFGPYMMLEPPAQDAVLITNATIWTSGPAGIIERGEIYIEGGLIRAVRALNQPRSFTIAENARVIDAAGRHVTPGLIDAHSHTGTWSAGTNEGAQAVTAEVRMQDTTDPDPVNWYRQLAGGATIVNTLHGSANPIGGQNVVQKVRWGVAAPNDMHLAGAIPGIKFALGENVKRARSRDSTRYPRTRMGVEALIRDRFVAAQQYANAWADWRARLGASLNDDAPQHAQGSEQTMTGRRGTAIDLNIGRGVPSPRRDLELEALAEILAGERLVHCHSYRQDEILMLCRVAQDFGFKIGTFQHVLEGYKVAEAIEQNAIGGSCFSDWWAYKIEVQDAIPYNGAIMHDVGVVVSFNSDSDELARRLNTEAAKAVRYGNITPEEALKFVTINPAIQLMIDSRVGSLEVGKDADLVIWSGDPLSTFTRCEMVLIDGREYFSLDRDGIHRERIAAQRNRIIQKILAEDSGKDKEKGEEEEDKSEEPGLVADPYADALREFCLDLYLSGLDPMSHLSDGCGVSLLEHLDAFMQGRSTNHSHN